MMTRSLFAICSGAIVSFFASTVGAQTNDLTALWQAERYEELVPALVSRWNAGEKNSATAFMLGTSLCRQCKKTLGIAFLQEAQSLVQTEEDKQIVASEIALCSQLPDQGTEAGHCRKAATSPIAMQPKRSMAVGAKVSGHMKGGYLLVDDSQENHAVIAEVRIPREELHHRLLPVDKTAETAKQASKRVPRLTIATSPPFAVLAENARAARPTANCLQRYRLALEQRFAMHLPPYAVTVYVPKSVADVKRFSEAVHGAGMPFGTVAYSLDEDLSIVGAIAAPNRCGTLAHELVHLMIRGGFGNSPAWFEEGLASEVAVAELRNDRLAFAPHEMNRWRDRVLRRNWHFRPTVAKLLASSWSDFQADARTDLEKVAAMQAMAALFVRYLDHVGKLDEVYTACRDRHLDPEKGMVRPYADLVVDVLGKPLDAVDSSFVDWFQRSR